MPLNQIWAAQARKKVVDGGCAPALKALYQNVLCSHITHVQSWETDELYLAPHDGGMSST